MTQTKVVSRTGETPDAKSKRMAVEVPKRITDQREASKAIYDVVQPADVHRAARAARKRTSTKA